MKKRFLVIIFWFSFLYKTLLRQTNKKFGNCEMAGDYTGWFIHSLTSVFFLLFYCSLSQTTLLINISWFLNQFSRLRSDILAVRTAWLSSSRTPRVTWQNFYIINLFPRGHILITIYMSSCFLVGVRLY